MSAAACRLIAHRWVRCCLRGCRALSSAFGSARLGSAPLQKLTRQSITEPKRLIKLVDAAREQQWCLVNEELEEGLISLSVPIVGRDGRFVAAMNLSSQLNRTPPSYVIEHFLPDLKATAAEISSTQADGLEFFLSVRFQVCGTGSATAALGRIQPDAALIALPETGRRKSHHRRGRVRRQPRVGD